MTAQDLTTDAGPLRVLQCSRCFSVLSDTSTFVCDSLDERTLSTKAAVNVREVSACGFGWVFGKRIRDEGGQMLSTSERACSRCFRLMMLHSIDTRA